MILFNALYNQDFKILKLELLHFQNCLFVSQTEQNQTIGKYFATLAKHCVDNHSYILHLQMQ